MPLLYIVKKRLKIHHLLKFLYSKRIPVNLCHMCKIYVLSSNGLRLIMLIEKSIPFPRIILTFFVYRRQMFKRIRKVLIYSLAL